MTQVSLKRSGIVSLIRERAATGMPEHVTPPLVFQKAELDGGREVRAWLQASATVPMIDVRAYARWFE